MKFGLVNCLPSRVSLHAHFFFCLDSTQLNSFIEFVIVIPSLDTFNLSMGPTVVPMIRVPRVRIDLATLSLKWVQGGDDTSLQVYIELMASNHFPVMQDVP